MEALPDNFETAFIVSILAHSEAASGNYREAVRLYEVSAARFVTVGALADVALGQFYLGLSLRQAGDSRDGGAGIRDGLHQAALREDRHRLAFGVEATLLLAGEAVAAETGVRLTRGGGGVA